MNVETATNKLGQTKYLKKTPEQKQSRLGGKINDTVEAQLDKQQRYKHGILKIGSEKRSQLMWYFKFPLHLLLMSCEFWFGY